MDPIIAVIIAVAAFIVGAAAAGFICFKMGVKHRIKTAEAQFESAEKESARIIEEANVKAEDRKKAALVEAKDEIYKMRSDAEKEISRLKGETDRELKERRGELSRSERRLQQKEENLDKKTDKMERYEEQLHQKHKKADEKIAEAEQLKTEQVETLERISGFTTDQAKEHLLSLLDSELTHEKAVKITAYEQKLKDEEDEIARKHISLAISRLAADTVSESAVSVVAIPNDKMKGRIIGREGRNIRALETLTGVDLIIDDTPRRSPCRASTRFAARSRVSPLKGSFRTAVSTPPALRRPSRRHARKSSSVSARKASAQLWRPTSTASTTSLSA